MGCSGAANASLPTLYLKSWTESKMDWSAMSTTPLSRSLRSWLPHAAGAWLRLAAATSLALASRRTTAIGTRRNVDVLSALPTGTSRFNGPRKQREPTESCLRSWSASPSLLCSGSRRLYDCPLDCFMDNVTPVHCSGERGAHCPWQSLYFTYLLDAARLGSWRSSRPAGSFSFQLQVFSPA